MKIRSIRQVNDLNCCPCDWPECDVSSPECQSITASVSSLGFYDPDDTSWKIYTETGSKWEVSQNGSYDGQTIELSAMEYSGDTYAQNFEGNVGQGLGCKQWTNTLTATCDTSGSYVRTTESTTDTRTRAKMIVDTETREHIAWEVDHAAWETAHATWESEHAAWVTDHATWVSDYAAWEIDHDDWNDEYAQFLIDHAAWVDGGEVGPEPTIRTEPVAPVEPVEPEEPIEPTEPTEFYGACEWEDTQVIEYLGESETSYYRNTSIGTMYSGIFGVPYINTTTTTYTNGKTYSEWVGETRAAILAEMDFENAYCIDDSECSSSYEVSAEPTEAPFGTFPLGMTVRQHRYRMSVPTGYTRTTWEDEWDEISASHDWWAWYDAGAIGAEPTPGPSLAAHRSWVWSGSGEHSDWFVVDVPDSPEEVRIANRLTTCWKSATLGNKPTASGPEVSLPE